MGERGQTTRGGSRVNRHYHCCFAVCVSHQTVSQSGLEREKNLRESLQAVQGRTHTCATEIKSCAAVANAQHNTTTRLVSARPGLHTLRSHLSHDTTHKHTQGSAHASHASVMAQSQQQHQQQQRASPPPAHVSGGAGAEVAVASLLVCVCWGGGCWLAGRVSMQHTQECGGSNCACLCGGRESERGAGAERGD